MKELIKITENNGKKAVSARDLYKFLELDSSQVNRWIETFITNNNFAVQFIDYERIDTTVKIPNGGSKVLKDVVLTIEFAKKLAMMSKTAKGEEARNYFIDCEKQLKEIQTGFVLPKNYIEALEALVVCEKAKVLLESKIEVLTPKAEVFDLTMSSGDNLSMGQTAKIIGYDGRNRLFKELRNRKILDSRNVPYQQYVDLKYFVLKEQPVKVKDETFVVPVTHVTQKGMAWICKILKIDSVQNMLKIT